MSRVEIHDRGRTVIVDTDDLDTAITAAEKLWTFADANPRATIEAGGMGFQAERVERPTYAEDCPGTVHR
jgi:thiazole synthase ThiGH ThiG subunit